MNKLLKIFLGGVLTIVLLIAAAIAYVMLVIDPNEYKAQIQDAAAEQGINLNIAGDLDWQLVPNLAIRIGETTLSGSTQGIPDTKFNSASLSLAWGPLLKKQIHVNAIAIDGADITISSSDEAATTATAPIAASSETSSNDDTGTLGIAVDSFQITNSRINLPGEASGQDLILDKLFFKGEQINLKGDTFPVSLSFDYNDSSLPKPINISLNTEVSFQSKSDELTLTGLNISSSGLQLSADVSIKALSTTPSASGAIRLLKTDLKAVLDNFETAIPSMPDNKALTNISLSTEFSASAEHIQIQDLLIKLDDTTITGEVSMKLSAPKQLAAIINGDTIDLNRYITASDSEAGNTTTDDTAQKQAQLIFAPLIAPLVFLDGGSSTLEFNWGELLMDQLAVNTIHLAATTKGSTVNITDFSASTLGGDIKSTARLGNLKGKQPNINYTAQLNNISLTEVTKAFAEDIDTSGTLTASVQGKSRGATSEQLFDNLTSNGTLQIVDPELKTINIEQSYCRVAALVENIALKKDWPPGTKLNNVDGKFRMQGRTLLLDGLSSGVGNLTLKTSGKVDLDASTFNILAITRLEGDRTSETGCIVESTKLRDRDIPLRCKDSFESASAKSCLPDGDFVKQFAKDSIIETIGKKSGLSEESKEAVDSLLKGLFGD